MAINWLRQKDEITSIIAGVKSPEELKKNLKSLTWTLDQGLLDLSLIHICSRDSDFFMLESDGEACQQLVCDLVCRRLPQSYGFDPFEDIQVLCPSKIGPLGKMCIRDSLLTGAWCSAILLYTNE